MTGWIPSGDKLGGDEKNDGISGESGGCRESDAHGGGGNAACNASRITG